MPAFSAAICSIVSPSLSVWSRDIDVMMLTRGFLIILVESPLPPSPTSSTAKSAPASLKYTNATAVMTSNSVGESYPISIIFSTVSRTIAVYFSSSASDI